MRNLILLFSLLLVSVSVKAELNSDVIVDTSESSQELQYWII